jgi:hypothetical protein
VQRAGKLPIAYRIPDAHRNNLPQALEAAFAPHRANGRFTALPYGTDLSDEELKLGKALRALKARSSTLAGKLGIGAALLAPLPRGPEVQPLFERMGLARPRGLRERVLRRIVAAALR